MPEEDILIISRPDLEIGIGSNTVIAQKLECVVLVAKGAAKNVRTLIAANDPIRIVLARQIVDLDALRSVLVSGLVLGQVNSIVVVKVAVLGNIPDFIIRIFPAG